MDHEALEECHQRILAGRDAVLVSAVLSVLAEMAVERCLEQPLAERAFDRSREPVQS